MRTNDDDWDLRTGVGTTATLVAAARAVASRQPDPMMNDPFAEVFVRAVGLDLMTQIVDGIVDFADIGAEWLPRYFGIRTRFIDDFAAEAWRVGIRQAVILASGLDARAYRLDWPASMAIYELDRPEIIDWKQRTIAGLGWTSTAQHRCVGIDLRHDWAKALRQAGFNDEQPTAWIVEGLLIGYLPPQAQDQILDTIDALSAPGSRIVADHTDVRRPHVVREVLHEFHDIWCRRDPAINLRDLTFPGTPNDPAVYLVERGWITRNANLTHLFQAAGRAAPSSTDFPANAKFMLFLHGTKG